MPIYEYRCNACEQIFEEWQKSFESDQPDCPVCGGNAERIMSNTTFVLKGGGWYASEYGRGSTPANSAAGAAPSSEVGSAESGTSTASSASPADSVAAGGPAS